MDFSKYHTDWKDIIRPSILKRDNYKCRTCGIGHKQTVYKDSRGNYVELDSFQEIWAEGTGKKVFKIYLQVAHVDQDKSNNDPLNLLTLCPKHHAQLDAKYKSFARIKYKAKMDDSNTKKLTDDIISNKSKLLEIKKIIKDIAHVSVSLVEADAIYSALIDLD